MGQKGYELDSNADLQPTATSQTCWDRSHMNMPACPHCNQIIDRKVTQATEERISFKAYRSCPFCGGLFTVDRSTKRRQAIGIVIALVSLCFTLGLYYQGKQWLIPAIVSYIILGVFIYWGNKQVLFVPYKKDWNRFKMASHNLVGCGAEIGTKERFAIAYSCHAEQAGYLS